ncbi:hypothetical protein [Bradyrhizobium diazoefficiens]|uniref:hypothetical protein n=1 Tax=Bradyrhizobium diazoefficiens TaxID=1355477 RepID=UPI00383308E1
MGNIERWLLALLSVLVIVSCVCATIVLMQATALKAEIATLQREIIALKLRVARLDQIASANEARDKPSTEAPKPPAENRPDQTALVLSREEIQLIRDYIKPAPGCGLRDRTDQSRRSRHGRNNPVPLSDHGEGPQTTRREIYHPQRRDRHHPNRQPSR